MKTSQLYLILFLGLAMILSACESEKSSVLNPEVFDLTAYVERLKQERPILNDVSLISRHGDFRDTISYNSYPIDSIANIILGFDFNRRERADEFVIKKSTTKPITCIEMRPVKQSDIIHMTVCQRNEQVISLNGVKRKKSLLGVFEQSYHFDPKSSFELQSKYIDKVNTDTLHTTNSLYWN